MSKYDPLCDRLKKETKHEVTMTFADIERIIGEPLPSSAAKHNEWWANETSDKTRHVQCRAWRDAGYEACPDLKTRTVTFVRRAATKRGGE